MPKMWCLSCVSLFIIIHLSSVHSNPSTCRNETTSRTKTILFRTRCRPCPINDRFSSCPVGWRNSSAVRTCTYSFGWGPHRTGCRYHCIKNITTKPDCCRGYWGQHCLPCPGLIASGKTACFGNGQCGDLQFGNGTCRCNGGFEGFGCEKCKNKNLFGDKCQKVCTCQNGICDSGVLGNGTCQIHTCHLGFHGNNCEIFEPRCNKSCHKHSDCVGGSQEITHCSCKPGYSGNGMDCQEIDPCKDLKVNCQFSNTVCQYAGPGKYNCVCRSGYSGDGIVCTAIDYCQDNYGNCSFYTKCNYLGPGKFNCSCRPGYGNYSQENGCTMLNLCTISDCPNVYSECYMVYANVKWCRCKQGYRGNGTLCYGNIIERIRDLNRDGPHKNQLNHVKRLLSRHTSISRPFTGSGMFTVFFPTDAGIESVLTASQLRKMSNDEDLAFQLVLRHSVLGRITTAWFGSDRNLTTLKGSLAVFTKDKFYQLLGQTNKSKMITTDLAATNGFIHVLDRPAWIPNFANNYSTSTLTLWQIIRQKPELRTLVEYIQIAGMESEIETSSTQEITLIAPVNEAFKELDSNETAFLKTARGKVKLQAILRNHIFEKKIGIMEMSSKFRSMLSKAAALIRITRYHDGSIKLERKAKLVENNILAWNGVLHLTNAILVPSFVKPIIQRICYVNSSNSFPSRCTWCSSRTICPSGSISIGQKTYCIYRRFGLYRFGYRGFRGCKTDCIRRIKVCCPGFYGPNCVTCPGPIHEPCLGNGKCLEGMTGNGTCSCNSSFAGTACELCRDYNTFGLSCNKTCRCVHGICDNGRFGNGSCRAGSCKSGYFGKDCATVMRACGYKRIPCNINGQCYMNGPVPRCECNFGYEGDGVDCYEIDLCQKNRGGCHTNAVCQKTSPGRRTCSCAPGWTGDGVYCSPINYCVMPSRGFCHRYARCIFLGPAKSTCECFRGYRGDGTSCEEINSCLINNGNCSSLAKCKKVGPGVNQCRCRFGYVGDGYRCFASMSVVMMHQNNLMAIHRLLVKSNVVLQYLSQPGLNITVFLPSNHAMVSLNNESKSLLAIPQNLFSFINFNSVRGLYPSHLISLNQPLQSLAGKPININVTRHQLIIGGQMARITASNIFASNGIIYIVDKVLLPSFDPLPLNETDLYQGLCNGTGFSEICDFVKKYELQSTLKSCDVCTIFAPNDQAFHDLTALQHENFNRTDLEYHITEHFIRVLNFTDGQLFAMLAEPNYVITLSRNSKGVTVNGVPAVIYRATSKWIIYNISSVLKPTQNICFKQTNAVVKIQCRSCYLRHYCPHGYRYADYNACVYSWRFLPRSGCRTTCKEVAKTVVRECCPGFYGKYCDACPGDNGKSCFGNGKCMDRINGTGHCHCKPGFGGVACEKCKEGHFGEKCGPCMCLVGALCNVKNGHCEKNVNTTLCNGNTTKCHQYASCLNKRTCQCDHGFTGNGTYCSYIHLCSINNGGCSPNAFCRYTANPTDPLKRTCSCKPNYKGDGIYCQGLNKCREGNFVCHPHASCIYTRPARYKCNCKAGYVGDGKKACLRFHRCSVYNLKVNEESRTADSIRICRLSINRQIQQLNFHKSKTCGQETYWTNNGGCSLHANCIEDWARAMTSCSCRSAYIGNGSVCVGTVMETLLTAPYLTEFYSRLKKSAVQEIFSPENIFSVIAPYNDAFPSSSRRKRRDIKDFSELDIKYYIVGCVSITKDDIDVPGKSFVSVGGLWLNITSPRVINNIIKIVSFENTTNGAILTVDRLIDVPASNLSNSNMSFIDVAKRNNYGQFIRRLTEAGMLDIVSNRYSQPFTMFWPTDEAISRLPADIKARLFSGMFKTEMKKIFKYHIISKTKITTQDILSFSGGLSRRTQEGSSLYISCKGQMGDIYINDHSKIVQRDISFLEGTAFGISEVLLPTGVGGRCDEDKYEEVRGSCSVCNATGVCPPDAFLQKVEQSSSCLYSGNYRGCLSTCLRRIKMPKCCKNFYGPDCQACLGVGKTCSGQGYCDGGLNGTGNCTCISPHYGNACEKCLSGNADCPLISKVCSADKSPCSIYASCDASETYLCKCIHGYEGNGIYCQEIDKCQSNNGGCNEHAICTYIGPNSVSCKCRPGFFGNGHSCFALPPSHPCTTNNGGCHLHANCVDKDGAAFCTCRKGFAGDGIYCGASLMQVIYDIEEMSEFAKVFRNLAFGVEGNQLINYLSSELDFTVFAPINYGFTVKRMSIYELQNHVVKGKFLFKSGTKQTVVSLARNNITVVMTKDTRSIVNNIAKILSDYPAINGVIHVIDHVLPYVKPPPTIPPPTTRPRLNTDKTSKPTDTTPHVLASKNNGRTSSAKVIGITGGVIVIVLIIIVVILIKKRRRNPAVRYNKNFENILLTSEPYTEEEEVEDDYEHPELQPASADIHVSPGTCIKNPTYTETDAGTDSGSSSVPLTENGANTFGKGSSVDYAGTDADEHLEMTECSSIVPLTENDATTFGKGSSVDP